MLDDDILSDVLRAVRLSGAIYFDIHASAPWIAQAPPSRDIRSIVMPGAEHVIEYHVLVEGRCWAELTDGSQPPVLMEAGSVIVFPQGDPHVLSTEPHARAEVDFSIFQHALASRPYALRVGRRSDGPGDVQVICGFLGCDIGPFNPLLQSLPRMMHIADGHGGEDDWLKHLIAATQKENAARRLGGGGILAKLSELIFIEVVRRYAESDAAELSGWLGGLRDPQIGQVLRLLHTEPARNWTLAELARRAGVSRTVLAERFSDCLGMGPIGYLQTWRMQLAAGMLGAGSEPLSRIALAVGYESEAAFSRAFKRTTGLAPSSWRDRARQPTAAAAAAGPAMADSAALQLS